MIIILKLCGILGLLAGVVYCSLGYFILRMNRTFILSRIVSFFLFMGACWSMSISLISFLSLSGLSAAIYWWAKISYLCALLLPILFFHLTCIFLGVRKKQYVIAFGYGLATALGVLACIGERLLSSFTYQDCVYYIPGGLYPVFLGYSAFFVGYSYWLLLQVYSLAIGYKRYQIKYFMIGAAFLFLQLGTTFPIISFFPVTHWSALLAIPSAGFFLYGIWKYRLFNMSISITREFAYKIFSTITVGLIVFLVVLLGQILFFKEAIQDKQIYLVSLFAFFCIVVCMGPLDKLLNAFIEKFLFQKKYEYQKTLRDAARGMAKITDIDKLFGLIVHFITSRIRIKSVDLFYLNKGDNKYVARLSRGIERQQEEKNIFIHKNSSLVLWLEEKKDILIYDEVARWLKNERLFPHKTVLRKTLDDIKNKFEELEVVLCVPCFSKNKLLGFLMLGEKTSGEIYTQEDLDVLSTLSHEAAIAIENAQLYEEIYEKMKHIQNLYEKEKKLFVSTAIAFAAAIDAKDKYTHGHAERVTYYCMSVYEEMQLLGIVEFPLNFQETLQIAALLHDVGKIGTPDSILNKKGPLTKEEYEEIKRHPVIGASILYPLQDLREVTEAIRYHQERYDGTGYPDGLKGDQIPLAARIIMVADTFDAMVSDRPYRPRVMEEVAVGEIKRGSGIQFDPKVVEGFLSAYEKGKIIQFNTKGSEQSYYEKGSRQLPQNNIQMKFPLDQIPPLAPPYDASEDRDGSSQL